MTASNVSFSESKSVASLEAGLPLVADFLPREAVEDDLREDRRLATCWIPVGDAEEARQGSKREVWRKYNSQGVLLIPGLEAGVFVITAATGELGVWVCR